MVLRFSPIRFLLVAASLWALTACKVPEQRQGFYPNGFLQERYWVYRVGGQEVMDGLYTSWFPNGEKEVEILYRDGKEITKTYYSDHGIVLGTVNVAEVHEP